MERSKRKVYIDVMRIVAIFLVLFSHTHGFTFYQHTDGIERWVCMFISITTRIHVPLLLMVSGSLLFRKVEDYNTVIRKRVLRFCVVIIIFSAITVLCKCIVDVEYKITLVNFVFGLFSNDIIFLFSYWYLYAYLGLLFTLPFMQRIAQSFSKQDFYVILGLHFIVFTFIPIVNVFFENVGVNKLIITNNFTIPLATTKVFFFPLVGYYLDNNIDVWKLTIREWGGVLSGGILCVIISSYLTYYEGSLYGSFTQNFISLFDYILSIIAFVFVKYITVVKFPSISKGKIARVICLIASLTFGMYLFDPLLKIVIYNKYEMEVAPLCSLLLLSYGWCVISMLIGGIFTYLLKQISVFRKIL